MKELLEQIRIKAIAEIEAADNTEELRVKYLGKKGELTAVLRGMGKVSPAERPIIGQLANEVRATIEAALSAKAEQQKKKEMECRRLTEKLDVTLPGKVQTVGHRHPIAQTEEMLRDIFIGMGFSIAEGPEVEYDYYNFEALNLPKNHPARDTQDTFYITDNILLRSQTSPVQVRVMENKKPPIRIISPGRVYRADPADATHSPIFHQVEGLVVDKGITMGDLKGILELFAKQMFGEKEAMLFGEGYGKGIQAAGKAYNPEGVDFILFDLLIVGNYQPRESVEHCAAAFGLTTVPVVGKGTLDEAIAFVKGHPQSTLGDIPMEGIVCRPEQELRDRCGNRVICKIKWEDFRHFA